MSRRTSRPAEPPVIRVSPKLASGLTDYRKGMIVEDIDRGIIVEGKTYENSHLKHGTMPTPGITDEEKVKRGAWLAAQDGVSMGTARKSNIRTPSSPTGGVVHSVAYKQQLADNARVAGLIKTAASIGTAGGGAATSEGSSFERLATEVYSPLFTMANLNLPRDRTTVNAWIRNFFLLHPIVRNVITLHATYPISKLNIKCHDPKVRTFFEDMLEESDALTMLGDVSLEWWKMGEKLQGSSLVTMSDGTLKPISEVKVGDYVLTHLGNKKKVVNTFEKPTDKVIEEHLKIYRIHTEGVAEPLIISGKHPVLSTPKDTFSCDTPSCVKKGMRILPDKVRCGNCRKPKKYEEVPMEFTETNDLNVRDLVYSPFDTKIVQNDQFTSELCYLMGFWLAEGCYCKTKNSGYKKLNGIKFCNYDLNFLETRFIPAFEKFMQNSGKNYVSKSTKFVIGKNKYDFWYEGIKRNGPQWAEFFMKHCGEYSKTKKLSQEVMNLPYDLQLQIIAGFIDGDGCVDIDNGHLIICTSSRNLANQFLLILRRNGIHTSISKTAAVEEENVAEKFRIKVIANESFDLFKNLIRPDKASLLRKSRWCSPHTAIYKNWQMLTIKKINDITEEFNEPFMYDLEVEDDHSYIANGIAVHNCFPYCEFDESSGKWSRYIIQNPDYIHVKKSIMGGEPIITLRPDQVLQRLVLSNNPADVQLRQQIPPNIIHSVRTGQDIRLDNFNVSHLKMLSSPYDIRGTSIVVSAFKDLALWDKVRECKYAQADGLINPITVVKVGGSADGDYRATEEDLENYRQMLEECQYDKSATIVTHYGVEISRVGASGQVLEFTEDINLIIKNIYTALMIPPAVIDQESSVYASASIGLEVLRQRYFNFRNMIARWLTNKVFAPISEVQGFFEYKDGKKRLIVPEIEWNQMNLYDLSDYIQNITGLVGSKQASVQTLYRSLGLNYDDEKIKMRQERIDAAISQREEQALAVMSLSELRALDPEKPISEPAGEAAPEGGAAPQEMPQEAGGLAGMPPMGGGGLSGGLPELTPPPAPQSAPGAPAGEVAGGAPALGPGTTPAGGPPMKGV